MQKQYRVVVPFGGNSVGDILGSTPAAGGEIWVHAKNLRGSIYGIALEFISDKVEEVKPSALRKWLVEEVATRMEATELSGCGDSLITGDGVDDYAWVKITEQREEKWVSKIGDRYWSTSDGIDSPDSWPLDMEWGGDGNDLAWLAEGDVFKTEAECQAYIDSKKKAV
jgi:hypothetical protein